MNKVIFGDSPSVGEPLLYYLDRVTRSNHYLDIGWVIDGSNVFQKPYAGRPRLLRELVFGLLELAALETFCGAQPGSLSTTTHQLIDGDSSLCSFGGSFLPVDQLAPLRRRRCPICESEGRPAKRVFELALYTACHEHGCWLEGDCTGCHQSFRHTQPISARCQACAEPIRLVPRPAHPDAIEASTEIARLDAGLLPRKEAPYSSLAELLIALSNLALLSIPDCGLGRFDLTLHKLPDAELRRIVCSAWPWLQSKERCKLEYEALVAQRRAALPSSPAKLWRLPFDHQCEFQDGAVFRRLRGWVADSDLQLGSVTELPPRIRTDLLNNRTAASALGVSLLSVKAIARAGLLACGRLGTKSFESENTYSAGEIDDLFSRIRTVNSPADADWLESGAVGLHDAGDHRNANHSVGVSRVLTWILERRVRAYLPAGGALDDIKVNREDLVKPTETSKPDLLTLKEAAGAMNVPRSALYGFIKTGFLKGESAIRSGRRHLLVPLSEVQRFTEGFVLANNLARLHKVHHVILVERLLFAGVTPACGPHLGCAAAYVFSVKDLSNISFSQLLVDPTFTRRRSLRGARRPPKSSFDGLLSAKQVAERLKLSRAKLGRLVAAKGLARHLDPRLSTNRTLFTMAEVERFERRFAQNLALIPVGEAMRLLGTTEREFRFDYVQTEKLVLIDDGAGRLYADRAAVEGMLRSEDLVTRGQAIRAFQLSRVQFRNLRLLPAEPVLRTPRRALFSRAAIQARLAEQAARSARLTG